MTPIVWGGRRERERTEERQERKREIGRGKGRKDIFPWRFQWTIPPLLLEYLRLQQLPVVNVASLEWLPWLRLKYERAISSFFFFFPLSLPCPSPSNDNEANFRGIYIKELRNARSLYRFNWSASRILEYRIIFTKCDIVKKISK